jgi:hypothetical protein
MSPARASCGRLIASAMLLGACHATPEVQPDPDGPLAAGALGRQPFRCEQGQLLARDADDASDVAALLVEVAGDFRERTGREPFARLLVVAGAGGWGDSDEQRVVLGMRGQAALDGKPPPTASQEATEADDLAREAAKGGMPPAVLLVLRPVPLLPAQLDELGLPPDVTALLDWGLVLPAPDEVDDAVEQAIDAALEHEDINFAQRLLIAPFLPFMRGMMSDAVQAMSKGLVFSAHAAVQPDWDAERRQAEVKAYVEELTGEIDRRMDEQAPAEPQASP